LATRAIGRPRSICGTASLECVRVLAAAKAATASSWSFAMRLKAALASSRGMLLLRLGLPRRDCAWLEGVEVGESGPLVLLALVLETLGPSLTLPGTLRNAVLTDSWLWLSPSRVAGRECTNFGSSPFFMWRNCCVVASMHHSLYPVSAPGMKSPCSSQQWTQATPCCLADGWQQDVSGAKTVRYVCRRDLRCTKTCGAEDVVYSRS
jgi:hypothetical protein